MNIEQAQFYRQQAIALLIEEKLPVDDLPANLENFFVVRLNNEVIATAGFEVYGNYGLLRSVVVQRSFRGIGIAADLLQHIETVAADKSLQKIYLLTETAPGYFGKRGYRHVTRAEVPADIKSSSEFSHVCPASAMVFLKTII
jgi:amino-acid N-acetyltransferase